MGVRCRLFAPLCLNIYAQIIRVSISSLTECASRRPKIQKYKFLPLASKIQRNHITTLIDSLPACLPLSRDRGRRPAPRTARWRSSRRSQRSCTTRRVAAALRCRASRAAGIFTSDARHRASRQRAPVHPSNLPPLGDHEGGARRLPRTSIVSERYLRRCRRELQHLVSRIGRGEWLSATVVGRCAVGR